MASKWWALVFALGFGGGAFWLEERWVRDHIEHEGMALEAVASEAAAKLSGDAQRAVDAAADPTSAEFLQERDVLRRIAAERKIRSPIYTLRKVDDHTTAFVVMTNQRPFIGHTYELRPEMEPVFAGHPRMRTGLYGDDHGAWVSGYAPVVDHQGNVVAIVSVDRPSSDLVEYRFQSRLKAILVTLLIAWLSLALPRLGVLRSRPIRGLQQLLVGSLASRIGGAGALAVLLAVSTMAFLDHRRAETEAVQHTKAALSQAVSLGSHVVDARLHSSVASTLSHEDDDFEQLRRQLRSIKEGAGLESPVYTLAQDGELVRFIGMTNEYPYVGDTNELRPGVRRTFEGGGAGTEGPYSDAHGVWISAWAPILDSKGKIVGVIQADRDVRAMMLELTSYSLLRALYGLIGVFVALVAGSFLARGIARPVQKLAEAARKVGSGELDIRLPEERVDEVGDLARAVNRMAVGLKERERLRDMFGKYMATQVIQELLDRNELSLDGELREVTVVLSDIRGYTALTEELGAAEVVQLLNEYFSILVDVIIEYDGVIDKFMGDAMLCWFGAPVPQKDHGERGVQAAKEILRRTAAWNQARLDQGKQPVLTGIGIATGQVVVGNIGSPHRLEYTAIGDAVNLASRLCNHAEAGQIVVTDRVLAKTTAQGFESLGHIEVKGIRDPVHVYRAELPTVA